MRSTGETFFGGSVFRTWIRSGVLAAIVLRKSPRSRACSRACAPQPRHRRARRRPGTREWRDASWRSLPGTLSGRRRPGSRTARHIGRAWRSASRGCPTSATRAPSSTTIRSAMRTVQKRCETSSVILPSSRPDAARGRRRSARTARARSRRRARLSVRRAPARSGCSRMKPRASASFCHCPKRPRRLRPGGPSWVSSPAVSRATTSSRRRGRPRPRPPAPPRAAPRRPAPRVWRA